MVILFDILLVLCVTLTLWFGGYVLYRSVLEETPRR